jgi:putative SOS response-associated peptidase YedK
VEATRVGVLIPHFCERRPDFAPIHARAETVAENEWFSDAYRRRRCIVPMNSFFQNVDGGKRYAISGLDCQLFGVAGIWENSASRDEHVGAHFRRRHRSAGQCIHCADPRPHARHIAE